MSLARILKIVVFILLTTVSTFSQNHAAKELPSLGDSLLAQHKYSEAFDFFSYQLTTATEASKGQLLFKAGLALYYQKKYEKSLVYLELATKETESTGNDELLARILLNIGACYTSLGKLAEGVNHYKLAIPPIERLNDYHLLGIANLNIAHNYKEKGSYDEAIKYLRPAIESMESDGDQRNLAKAYQTLGNTYRALKKDSLSIEYHQRSLKINRVLGNKAAISSNLNDLANTYKNLYDYDKALDLYRQSLAIGDSMYQATTLGHLAEIYGLQGKYSQAEAYFYKALLLRRNEKDIKAVADLLTDLGELYLNMGEAYKARKSLMEAMQIAGDENFNDIMLKNLKLQQTLFERDGDFKSAYNMQARVMELNERIFNKKGQELVEQLTIDFEVKDLEKQNALLSEEQKLDKAIIENERANQKILLLALILSVVVVLFVFAIYWQGREQTKFQVAKRLEIQHRTKNFLQTLINLFQFQVQNINQPDAKAVMKVAQNRLDAMMRIHRSLSSNLDELNFTEYARELVGQIRRSYMDEVADVQVNWDTDDIFLNADLATPVAIILNELVSNSFKHALSKISDPNLLISLKILDTRLSICVQDNGPGIQIENANKVDSEGLKLIRIFVRQLNGRFESSNENGTKAKVEVKVSRYL